MMRPIVWVSLTPVAGPACVDAQTLQKPGASAGRYGVPIEIARPAGSGAFAPVLYIHARRGFEDEDRAHMRELAAQGFLVPAPDWQRANMIVRWPDRHDPEAEVDVEVGLDALLARKGVCKGPVRIVALSRGPYFAIRLAAKRPRDIAAIVSYYDLQDPNAPEPQQLFSIAPEVNRIGVPVLMLIGDIDLELRGIVNGRDVYALYKRGVAVELQMYPMARRAFDFRRDAAPEEKVSNQTPRARARSPVARSAHRTRPRRAVPIVAMENGGHHHRCRARRCDRPRDAAGAVAVRRAGAPG